MQIGDDWQAEALPGNGEEDVCRGLSPHDVGLGAGGRHGREEKVEIILACELLNGGHVGAQPH